VLNDRVERDLVTFNAWLAAEFLFLFPIFPTVPHDACLDGFE